MYIARWANADHKRLQKAGTPTGEANQTPHTSEMSPPLNRTMPRPTYLEFVTNLLNPPGKLHPTPICSDAILHAATKLRTRWQLCS